MLQVWGDGSSKARKPVRLGSREQRDRRIWGEEPGRQGRPYYISVKV